MDDIECTVEADVDETYRRDGCLWRGHLQYSNGTAIPFKLSAGARYGYVAVILVVDSLKSYRKRIGPNESFSHGPLRAVIEEAVYDFWPEERKCPFGREM